MQRKHDTKRPSSKRDEEASGIGTGLLALGAAALGAVAGAAIYHGVQYFMNQTNEEQPFSKPKNDSNTEKFASNSRQPCSDERKYVTSDTNMAQFYADNDKLDKKRKQGNSKEELKTDITSNLHSELLAYTLSYITIAESAVISAKQILNKFSNNLESVLNVQIRQIKWDHITENCAMSDFILVRYANEFYMTLPFSLAGSNWSYESNTSSGRSTKNTVVANAPLSNYSEFLNGDCLSSKKLVISVIRVIQSLKCDTFRCEVDDMTHSNLHVRIILANHETIMLHICFNMMLENTGIVLMPDSFDGWQISTRNMLENKLKSFSSHDSCGTSVLRILKAVQLNHPHLLSKLDSFAWFSVLFHVSDYENEWDLTHLPERFLDLLKALEKYVEERHLPDYFNDQCNYLADFTDEDVNQLSNYLAEIFGSGKFNQLLLKIY